MDPENLASICLVHDNSSTKQPNTKILSSESAGDVNPGAFGVLRVEFVLRDADRAACLRANLWTHFLESTRYRTPVFSVWPVILCFLRTRPSESTAFSEHEFVRFRNCFVLVRLE